MIVKRTFGFSAFMNQYCASTLQAARTTFPLDTHGDNLAIPYFSAVLRVRNVSAISIQLCWRATARRGVVRCSKNWLALSDCTHFHDFCSLGWSGPEPLALRQLSHAHSELAEAVAVFSPLRIRPSSLGRWSRYQEEQLGKFCLG